MGPIKKVTKNINSKVYQEEIINDINVVCKSLVFPQKSPIFMHNLAPAHNSISTQKFLAERNVSVLPWPENSADCNIIENVWSYISRWLQGYNCTTSEGLWNAVQKIWWNIPSDYIKTLYQSMPNRVKFVNKGHGRITKY